MRAGHLPCRRLQAVAGVQVSLMARIGCMACQGMPSCLGNCFKTSIHVMTISTIEMPLARPVLCVACQAMTCLKCLFDCQSLQRLPQCDSTHDNMPTARKRCRTQHSLQISSPNLPFRGHPIAPNPKHSQCQSDTACTPAKHGRSQHQASTKMPKPELSGWHLACMSGSKYPPPCP